MVHVTTYRLSPEKTSFYSVKESLPQISEVNPPMHSPWSPGFNWERREKLNKKIDIGIVGAGISGVMQAYHILKNTDRSVTLYDEGRVGSGATGNNAAHLTPTLEYMFQELEQASYNSIADSAERRKLVGNVFRSSLEGYHLYEKLLDEIPELKSFPFFKVNGLDAIPKHLLKKYLDDLQGQYDEGIEFQRMLVTPEAINELPWIEQYNKVYTVIPKETLRDRLKTKEDIFPAAIESPAILLNSSELANRLVQHLMVNYPNRFKLHENTHITRVDVNNESVTLYTKNETSQAEQIILCTNGYTGIDLHDSLNSQNNEILNVMQPNFGAMIGYLVKSKESDSREPATISYKVTDEYPYIRCIPVIVDAQEYMFYAFGGPTQPTAKFHESYQEAFKKMQNGITEWISTNLTIPFNEEALQNPQYLWTGRMLYTTDGLRRSGPLPKDPRLWVNLGCNGIELALAASSAERNSQIKLPRAYATWN